MEANWLGEFSYNSLRILYRRGTEDEKVLAHSFDKDIFFKEIPSFKPRRTPTIIDVGAHIGTFSLLSHLKFPQSHIYSVEASQETYDILKKNILINSLPIRAFHNALLDRNGTVKLFHNSISGNWGHSVTKEFDSSFEEVQSVTFEQFIRDNEIEFIDLIKFNCEGSEFSILMKTSAEFINKIGLGIILYHEDLAEQGYRLSDLASLFDRNSFRTLVVPKSDQRGWLIVWNKRIYSKFYFIWSAIYRRLTRRVL